MNLKLVSRPLICLFIQLRQEESSLSSRLMFSADLSSPWETLMCWLRMSWSSFCAARQMSCWHWSVVGDAREELIRRRRIINVSGDMKIELRFQLICERKFAVVGLNQMRIKSNRRFRMIHVCILFLAEIAWIRCFHTLDLQNDFY